MIAGFLSLPISAGLDMVNVRGIRGLPPGLRGDIAEKLLDLVTGGTVASRLLNEVSEQITNAIVGED